MKNKRYQSNQQKSHNAGVSSTHLQGNNARFHGSLQSGLSGHPQRNLQENSKRRRTYTSKRKHIETSVPSGTRRAYKNNLASRTKKRRKPRSRILDREFTTIPFERGRMTITRRHFIYGAGLTVALVALVGGGYTINNLFGKKKETRDALTVNSSSIQTNKDLTSVDAANCVSLTGDYRLDYGTQLWCNSSSVAACLVPGATGNPLNTIQLLWLSNGKTEVVVKEAVNAHARFQILDVRATQNGLVWVESDMMDGDWCVFTATLSQAGLLDTPRCVDTGSSDWELPSIGLCGNKAFWQVMPTKNGAHSTSQSAVKTVSLGSDKVEVVYKSTGQMATPLQACGDYVVITPRSDSGAGIQYSAICIDAQSGKEYDSLLLPVNVRPLDAGYCNTGFALCLDLIYNNNSGISNIGTYFPTSSTQNSAYNNASWFSWERVPNCIPANCGDYCIVKSTSAVCGVHLDTLSYFALDVETGCADYGDMLATTGKHDSFVTYSNVKTRPLSGESEKYCHVRVWKTL